MTGDTITPVSMFPVVHATWDDPDHPAFNARQEICDAADGSPRSACSPTDRSLRLPTTSSRCSNKPAMLNDAARHGSRVCEHYGIDPQHLLDWAMPNRVVIGPLGLGASASNGMINNALLLPGLDAGLLRAADEHGVEVLAYGLDHITESMPALQAQLHKLAIVSDDDFFHGPELTDLLSGDGRCRLPGLDEIPSRTLDTIATGDLANHCGVKIDSSAVRYFSIGHARLKCTPTAPTTRQPARPRAPQRHNHMEHDAATVRRSRTSAGAHQRAETVRGLKHLPVPGPLL
jgi:hypothetical protein